jgi:hypothetical protein
VARAGKQWGAGSGNNDATKPSGMTVIEAGQAAKFGCGGAFVFGRLDGGWRP